MDTFDAAHWPRVEPFNWISEITPLHPREARDIFLQLLHGLTGIDARERPAP